MKYFYKVSWQDSKQPLMRKHENGSVDLSDVDMANFSGWEIAQKIMEHHLGRWAEVEEFCVDFLLPIKEND